MNLNLILKEINKLAKSCFNLCSTKISQYRQASFYTGITLLKKSRVNKTQYFQLTLSDRAEYIYSVTSHATSLDGVLVLRDFHNLVKKKY
jgi:hypothetical protein